MFVGLIPIHASDVPLVLNLTSGVITAQFHVVFDDLFTTVSSFGISRKSGRLSLEVRQIILLSQHGLSNSRDYLMGFQASSRQDYVLEVIFRKKEWSYLKLMHQ